MTMEQRRLGTTGVWVSELCLGTMMFGEWGTKDHNESIRVIHRALGAGITFVDTADVYSAGESEVIVGKALAGRRDDIVLATKAFMPMSDNFNHRGSSRRWSPPGLTLTPPTTAGSAPPLARPPAAADG